MKITHHRFTGDEYIHLWILAVSQSGSVLSSFKCSQWCCVLKKMFNGKIFYRYKHIFLQHFWKKIMQALWTPVTYLLKKC